MRAFLDFEASSLSDRSYPIEVAWAWEDGRGESHLIRPADGWMDWDAAAEAVHRIPRATLERDGEPVDAVAARMLAELTGHDLFASAPSWDGKWLSVLLRGAGQPRHALRLRDTDEAVRESVDAILAAGGVADQDRLGTLRRIEAEAARRFADRQPAHRALPDAEVERERWRTACDLARDAVSPAARRP